MMSTTTLNLELPIQYTLEPASTGKGVLVLHGFGDRAQWAKRRMLGESKTSDYTVFAPNGFFPYPIKKNGYEFDEAYAWYFRDPRGNEMISPEVGAQTMLRLLEQLKIKSLDWTILGFSQGGFFAPHLVRAGLRVSRIIAVGAAFRSQSYQDLPPVEVFALHGDADDVVEPAISQQSFEVIQRMGYGKEFHLIKGLKHSLNDEGRQIVKRILES